VDGLRRRLASVSEWKGIRYWSATGKRWQTLIVDAYALESPDGGRRPDFSLDEVAVGKTVYFHQEDNLSGKAAYRLRIRSVAPGRLIFDTENVSPIRYLLVTLFDPGEAQAIYFLERESQDVWRYYGMARTGGNASSLIAGHEASLVNRAVAIRRRRGSSAAGGPDLRHCRKQPLVLAGDRHHQHQPDHHEEDVERRIVPRG
jgi:hypothetical protein